MDKPAAFSSREFFTPFDFMGIVEIPRGGARRGAGRPKGSIKTVLRKQGRKQIAPAKAKRLTPLECMLTVMYDEAAGKARRDRMAQAAAPYVHARLAPEADEQRSAKCKRRRYVPEKPTCH
jgi:hypothetical protein